MESATRGGMSSGIAAKNGHGSSDGNSSSVSSIQPFESRDLRHEEVEILWYIFPRVSQKDPIPAPLLLGAKA